MKFEWGHPQWVVQNIGRLKSAIFDVYHTISEVVQGSYYRRLIGTAMQSIELCHFQ